MSIIRITIEDEMYHAVKDISKGKGISVSDAVRAYLRAVVKTNSLAINTILSVDRSSVPMESKGGVRSKTGEPTAPRKKRLSADYVQVPLPTEISGSAAPEKASAPEKDVPIPVRAAETPPVPSRRIKIPETEGNLVDKYVALICLIPDGLLSTWEELEQAVGSPKPLHDEWPRTIRLCAEGEEAKSVAIPYWRVLSRHGSTKGDLSCSRDLREMMLGAEGHEIITTGRSMKVVQGYKKKLVRWEAQA